MDLHGFSDCKLFRAFAIVSRMAVLGEDLGTDPMLANGGTRSWSLPVVMPAFEAALDVQAVRDAERRHWCLPPDVFDCEFDGRQPVPNQTLLGHDKITGAPHRDGMPGQLSRFPTAHPDIFFASFESRRGSSHYAASECSILVSYGAPRGFLVFAPVPTSPVPP